MHSNTLTHVPDTKTHPGVLMQRNKRPLHLLHLLKNVGLLIPEVSWGLVPGAPAAICAP